MSDLKMTGSAFGILVVPFRERWAVMKLIAGILVFLFVLPSVSRADPLRDDDLADKTWCFTSGSAPGKLYYRLEFSSTAFGNSGTIATYDSNNNDITERGNRGTARSSGWELKQNGTQFTHGYYGSNKPFNVSINKERNKITATFANGVQTEAILANSGQAWHCGKQ